MIRKLDPKTLGLHHSTQIFSTGESNFLLKLDRKSRIIMKDGLNILSKAKRIKEVYREAEVGLVTNAPICSKTQQFLIEEGITVWSITDWDEFNTG